MRAATSAVARSIAASQALRSTSGRATVTSPPRTPTAHSSERSRKSAGSRTASAIPSFAAFGAGVILFCASAFSTMTVTAGSMPIRFGSSCVPPQPGTRPRKTSGKATIAVDAIVRYWQCSASSRPPPSATPLTKANVGTPASFSRRNTRCPASAISRAAAASVTDGTPERSAPTAKMNGLPVTPIATGAGEWAAISSSAASSDAIPPGPKVDGRVWSWPLSIVISANSPDSPGSDRNRTNARVTTSFSNTAVTCRPPSSGSPRSRWRPCPGRRTWRSGRSGRRAARRTAATAAS